MISDIEIRLLRVFKAVVESGGFTNAQVALNLSQSTVSNQMSLLESRIGFVLCQRGRAGFKLTSEGEAFYKQTVDLFNAVGQFESGVAEIKGRLSGTLRIGFLDNIITDALCPLKDTLSKFIQQPDNDVQISLKVLSPPALENAVLNNELDVAIGIFPHRIPGLRYEYLYRERDILVAHPDNPLASIDDPRLLSSYLPGASRIVRTFLTDEEFPFNDIEVQEARVSSLEASAILILSSNYIGFLPEHYAQTWLKTGELVELISNKFHRFSDFHAVIRDQQGSVSSALKVFLDCLYKVNEIHNPG